VLQSNQLSFDRNGYRGIIDEAKQRGYSIVPFRHALRSPSPAMILRHDIDISLGHAVELAELETTQGVQSTYFVMLTCDYYNALSGVGRANLRRIVELGHEIGLHWDSSLYPTDPTRGAAIFRREVEILSDAIGEEVVSASQHIPTDTPIFDAENQIPNEAYSKVFRDRFRYVSDSSMRWREHTPLDLFNMGVDVHFLAHPVWWVGYGTTSADRQRAAIELRGAELRQANEKFIDYMANFVRERDKFDRIFREMKGWN